MSEFLKVGNLTLNLLLLSWLTCATECQVIESIEGIMLLLLLVLLSLLVREESSLLQR